MVLVSEIEAPLKVYENSFNALWMLSANPDNDSGEDSSEKDIMNIKHGQDLSSLQQRKITEEERFIKSS